MGRQLNGNNQHSDSNRTSSNWKHNLQDAAGRIQEQRRQDIIEAAEKLFISQSFENTTMEKIANEAEYSKGTIYNYYNSKDELYIALGNKAYNLIIDYTKKLTDEEIPGIKQLMAVGYAYYEFTKKYPQYASIFHDIAVKLPDIINKPKKSGVK